MALITCRNVSFAYEGNTVVRDLNFSIDAGDYLCIVGENGSGKSTLMKGLLRLKQPQEGDILISDGLRPNQIGYLPQQTAAQKDFPASVFEVVLSGRLSSRGLGPFYSRHDKDLARYHMELLDIIHLEHKCYRELSGGQQQRVLLARALCATETLLLLDEPVAGLDPIVTGELYRLIQQINRQTGITIIMISHDIHAAVQYASHILHLKSRQIFYGKKEDYLAFDAGNRFMGGEDIA